MLLAFYLLVMTRLKLIMNFLSKVAGGCMLFGSLIYQPKHPFGNSNIKLKEQWRMQ